MGKNIGSQSFEEFKHNNNLYYNFSKLEHNPTDKHYTAIHLDFISNDHFPKKWLQDSMPAYNNLN